MSKKRKWKPFLQEMGREKTLRLAWASQERAAFGFAEGELAEQIERLRNRKGKAKQDEG